MKKFLAVMLVGVVALAGCSKNEPVKKVVAGENKVAHRMLIEGTVFLKQGDPVKAVELFASAVKTAPDYFEGYFMLGQTFVNLKQYPQAVAVMTAAVRNFPDNGLAYYLLGVAHEGVGQRIPAIIAARRSVELFTAAEDEEGVKRSSILLAVLIQSAKQEAADQAASNAVADAQRSLEQVQIPVAEPQSK